MVNGSVLLARLINVSNRVTDKVKVTEQRLSKGKIVMSFRSSDEATSKVVIESRALGICLAAGMFYGWVTGIVYCVAWSLSVGGNDFWAMYMTTCIVVPIGISMPVGALIGLLSGIFRRINLTWLPIVLLPSAAMCRVSYGYIVQNAGYSPNSVKAIFITALPMVLGFGVMAAIRIDYFRKQRLPFIARIRQINGEGL
jgi:hypothetical protein